MNIGETFINTDVQETLAHTDFFTSEEYDCYARLCINNVKQWMNGKNSICVCVDPIFANRHAIRLMIYHDSNIEKHIRKIQSIGLKYYKNALYAKILTAVSHEYASLPQFARNCISVEEYATRCLEDIVKKNKNKITKECTKQIYGNLRKIINRELW